ncbi:hypothetical protein ACHAPU_002713 [Fusarium lateritium]
MEVAGKVVEIVSGLIKDAAAERQTEIMTALSNIQSSIASLQLEEEQLEALSQASPSFTDISVWQQQYPVAVQSNDNAQIQKFLNDFNDNAASHIQTIFNVLTGQNMGPTAPSILPAWHLASYKKM